MVFGRLVTLLSTVAAASAVTVYTSAVNTAPVAAYTAASVDQTLLQAPVPPDGEATSVQIQLIDGGMTGMGLPVVSTLRWLIR